MKHKTSPTPSRHDIKPVLTQPSVGVPPYEEENVKDDHVIAVLIHLFSSLNEFVINFLKFENKI